MAAAARAYTVAAFQSGTMWKEDYYYYYYYYYD